MIETDRLLIRPWLDADAREFYELTHDAGFTRFPITDWRQASVEAAKEWIHAMENQVRTSKFGVFAVTEKPDFKIVGMTAIRVLNLETEDRPEITYRLRESAWGRGLATEAAKAMLNYGFDQLKLREIAASITPDNVASIKVAEKIGMTWTGAEILLGVQAEIYRISNEEFYTARELL